MIDNRFRHWISPYLRSLLLVFHRLGLTPNHVSVLAFLLAILSASFVIKGSFVQAFLIWWISRLLDACDGALARQFNQSTKFGSYLDIQLDMASYSIMVIAFSWRYPELQGAWMAMLLFYVLCVTGALSLGSLENQIQTQDTSGRGLRLAAGLAEGGETGLAYSVFLLFPNWIEVSAKIWLAILLLTVLARLTLAFRILNRQR